MPKKDVKMAKSSGGLCKTCKTCYWIYPLVILLIALYPGWISTTWAKWVLVVVAALMLLQKKCNCC